MKKLFLIFVIFTTCSAQSENIATTKKNLLSEFQKVNSDNIKSTATLVFSGLDKFSEITELTMDDVELTASVLKTLVVFDPYDPSRTAQQMMTVSFIKNQAVYVLAFERLSASEKKILAPMFPMLKKLNSNGNG